MTSSSSSNVFCCQPPSSQCTIIINFVITIIFFWHLTHTHIDCGYFFEIFSEDIFSSFSLFILFPRRHQDEIDSNGFFFFFFFWSYSFFFYPGKPFSSFDMLIYCHLSFVCVCVWDPHCGSCRPVWSCIFFFLVHSDFNRSLASHIWYTRGVVLTFLAPANLSPAICHLVVAAYQLLNGVLRLFFHSVFMRRCGRHLDWRHTEFVHTHTHLG